MSESSDISHGRALLDRGMQSESIAYFADLRKRHPDSARVHLHSAFALDRMGKEEEAVPLYERALLLGLSGTDARDAHVCLASSLRNVGRSEHGFDLLDSAKSRFDGDVVFELFFALLATEIGRADEAVLTLARSLLRESPDPDLKRYRNVLRGKFDQLTRDTTVRLPEEHPAPSCRERGWRPPTPPAI